MTTTLFGATVINIPDNSFEGLTATVNGPITGYLSNHIGSWSMEFNVILGLSESISSGTSQSLGGPATTNGTNEVVMSTPAGVGASQKLSQSLTNKFVPNSVYTLSVDLSDANAVAILSGTTLSLKSGTTPVASLSGVMLASVLSADSTFHTVRMIYKTGNTAPTGNIGIVLDSSSVAALGNMYVDNFQLTVAPISVELSALRPSPSSTNFTLIGSSGAPNATYVVSSATNLLGGNWTNVATNQFDANGNFQIDVLKDINVPANFWRIMMP